MSQRKPKYKNYKRISRKDILLDLIKSKNKLTISDLAIRLYGEDTLMSRNQIGQILSSLRKNGIWAYPRKKYGEVIIPKTMIEYRDVIKHIYDEGGMSAKVYRILSVFMEAVIKYPQLKNETQNRINEIEEHFTNYKKETQRIEYKK